MRQQYEGHGAHTGGLQLHSIGDQFPYTVIRQGARAEFHVAMDLRTGKTGRQHLTYDDAVRDIAALKIRNMMHS